jgi:capsular exopolysaccharide synthesis family protein
MTPSDSNGVEPQNNNHHHEANGTSNGKALVPADVAFQRTHLPIHAPPAPAFLTAKPDSKSLLKALKRRWLLASTVGFLAAAGTAVAVFFSVPTTYIGQTFLILSHKGTKIVGTDSDVDFSIFQRSEAARVKTRLVLTRAMRQPTVSGLLMFKDMREPVEWLENNIQVDYGASPEYMRISLIGEKPQELIVVLQAISDAYLDEAVNDELETRNRRLQKLNDAYGTYEESLRTKRHTYKELAGEIGTSSSFVLAFKQQFEMDQLVQRKNMLLNVTNDLTRLRTEAFVQQEKVKSLPKMEIPAELIDSRLAADSRVIEMEREIESLKTKAAKAAKGWSDGAENEAVKKIEKQREDMRQALQAYRQSKRPALADQLLSTVRARENEALESEKQRILILEKMETDLSAQVEKLSNQIKVVGTKGVELESLKEDLESHDSVAKTLRAMILNEKINLNTPPRVTRRHGETPDTRSTLKEDKKVMMAGATGAGAMVLVFLVIAYWEFLSRRILGPDDVVDRLGWRLVGSIPDIPSKHRRLKNAGSSASKHWSSMLTESVDATRAALLRTAATDGIRTVMITSAVAGEGKTSLSCHLATSLARASRKTLLIDGDLRRPSVHKMFDLPVDPGFAGLLRGDLEDEAAIRSTPAANLWIMPAGQCDAATLQALSEGKIKPILERLKEQFDFVIIDTSPVLPVVDALEIGQHVDVAIFSLLRDVSRVPNVYAAYERMAALGIRIIGAVVNGVRKDRYGYAYSYYYAYGYSK